MQLPVHLTVPPEPADAGPLCPDAPSSRNATQDGAGCRKRHTEHAEHRPPPQSTYEGSPACLTCALSSLRLLRAHQRGRLGMGQRLLRSRSQWHKDLLHRQTRPFTDHASSRERAQVGTSHFAAKELLQLPDITAPQNELARGSGPAWESGGGAFTRCAERPRPLPADLGRQKAETAPGAVQRGVLPLGSHNCLVVIKHPSSDPASSTPAHPGPWEV